MITYKLIGEKWESFFLTQLKKSSDIKIISPFIAGNIDNLLIKNLQGKSLKIISRFNLNNILAKSININIIEKFVNSKNIDVRMLSEKLHSKVYLYDDKSVLITSANLTTNGLNNNYEFGLFTDDPSIVNQSLQYFKRLWMISDIIDSNTIHKARKDLNKYKKEQQNLEKIQRINIDYAKSHKPYYYVNFEESEHRSWIDAVKYGFIAAGQGKSYSMPLKKLQIGDIVVVYFLYEDLLRKKFKNIKHGYIGYGVVTQTARMLKDFVFKGKKYNQIKFKAPNALNNLNSIDNSEYLVGVKWNVTRKYKTTITEKGIFANQNIVCRLKDKNTIALLKKNKLII